LFVGALCKEKKWRFYWIEDEDPFFRLPDGSIVACEVYGNVPYLRTNEPAVLAVAVPADDEPAADEETVVEDAGVEPSEVLGAEAVATRDLKAEAVSLQHLMTHTPKNPHCAVCQRAKMQRAPCRRKKWFKGPKPETFGDQVTADHVVANSDRSMGVTGEKSALIIGDRATGYIGGFPLVSKDAEDAEHDIREFAGSHKIKRAWTDCSPELILACRRMKILHDKATPGRP
jgi:hypothetical protein